MVSSEDFIQDNELIPDEKIWVTFLRRHWKMAILIAVAAIFAFAGAIFVYLRVVSEAQITGLVPETLDLWAMTHIISFILHLVFWEIIFIGIPVCIVAGAIIFLWWKRLPDVERRQYKRNDLFGSKSSNSDKSGGISFLLFIAFIIKINLDGNWEEPIAVWTFDYLVYSLITSFLWVVIIVGIPVAFGFIIWARYEMKKNR